MPPGLPLRFQPSHFSVIYYKNCCLIVTYVDPSADAAIAESSGKDFKFVNNTNYPIYIAPGLPLRFQPSHFSVIYYKNCCLPVLC